MGRPTQIQMDCADPESLAAFWAEVLDYRVATPGMGYATWGDWSEAEAREPCERRCCAVDRDGQGISSLLHRVPDRTTVKNRLHDEVSVATRGGDRGTS